MCLFNEKITERHLGELTGQNEREKMDTQQTWGQLLSNVINYITITLQFS
jgi:hypothetical protein